MQVVVSVFLIMLGIGQFIATGGRLWGASLVGTSRWAGYSSSAGLILAGSLLLPYTPYLWVGIPLLAPGVIALLLIGGSLMWPSPPPANFFKARHPAHADSRRVQISDGDHLIPGFLLTSKEEATGTAVCLLHGWGFSKYAFQWRMVQALLAEGITVLTIDLPGHGECRDRPLAYPDSLTVVPAAVRFLRSQPGIQRVGLIGISLGGAIAISALTRPRTAVVDLVDLLVVMGTPTQVRYSRALYYQELWNTYWGAPVLSLLRDTTVKHIWQSWNQGGSRSRHQAGELFELLNPLENIKHLAGLPLLLVYGRLDSVAPPAQAQAMRRAAPQAAFLEVERGSHMMLTLLPAVNKQIAAWVNRQLRKRSGEKNHFLLAGNSGKSRKEWKK